MTDFFDERDGRDAAVPAHRTRAELVVGPAADPMEREADRVAADVLTRLQRMSADGETAGGRIRPMDAVAPHLTVAPGSVAQRVQPMSRSLGAGVGAERIQRVAEYPGEFPSQGAVVNPAKALEVIDGLEAWLTKFEAAYESDEFIRGLPAKLARMRKQVDHGQVLLAANLDELVERLRTARDAGENGVSADLRSYTEVVQQEEAWYLDAPGGGVEHEMLRAIAAKPNGPIDCPPAWKTAPIPIPASDPAVPEALRVLIRFIASTDSAVGLEYGGKPLPVPQPEDGEVLPDATRNVEAYDTRGASVVGAEQRGPLDGRGDREFEKAHLGLVRSWHLDEDGRLPHPDKDRLDEVTADGGSGASYLAANSEDFSKGMGVPKKLRGKGLLAVGLAEFNTPKVGSNGRLVYDYVNQIFYFTPVHYQYWDSPAVAGDHQLFPFFVLTGTEYLVLDYTGAQELARLRYWETQRRAKVETLEEVVP